MVQLCIMYLLSTTIAAGNDGKGEIKLDALFLVTGRKRADSPNGESIDTRHDDEHGLICFHKVFLLLYIKTLPS